tara:strand:- start:7076 stop:8047 length:972 start_codon:yes stop_codon:yes gene_type:complete
MVLKAELHCHIEGAASPELVRRKARQNGYSTDGLIDAEDNYIWHDFSSFLNAYDRAAAMFVSEQDYCDLAYDYFSGAAAQGMIYGEVFISADHAEKAGLSYGAYVDALGEGIQRAREETGIEGRMIATCVRHFGPQRAEPVAQLLHSHPHPLVTGFGMAGDERMHHPADFATAFRIAEDAGLQITAHAGEFGGPDSIRAVLDELGVKRIGHGVRAIEDEALLARLREEDIVLELCPGSNVALGLYDNWQVHPFPMLKNAGLRLTLNSDDPPFFQTDISHEYDQAATAFGLSGVDQLAITHQAIEAAFVDDATRQRLFQRLFAD